MIGIQLKQKFATLSAALLLALSLAAPRSLEARDPARVPRCIESVLQTILRNAPAKAAVRPLNEIRTLRVASYNLLNLRENVGKWRYDDNRILVQVSPPQPAELAALVGKARAIRDINADIVIAQEVEGGLGTLQKFADQELDGAYKAYLALGNEPRGFNIGFLVKKDLPVTIELETHRDVTWLDPTKPNNGPSPLYSRDLPAMIVRSANQPNPDRPLLVVLGNHSKSMRDRPGDPQSAILRKAQMNQTAEIAKQYRTRFGNDARILVGGDFNTSIDSAEFRGLQNRGLTEAFSLEKTAIPKANRVTHTFHPRDGPRDANQIDAFFLSPGLSSDLSKTWVYRYKDGNGRPLPLPRTYVERELNPSDHFPIVLDLDFKKMYSRFEKEQLTP